MLLAANRRLHLRIENPRHRTSFGYPPSDLEKAVLWCQEKTGKELAPSQQEALKKALSSRGLILTGGPGVSMRRNEELEPSRAA
jgi:ATP-dependent exoDNAse (exonuclease V) alpha subunit